MPSSADDPHFRGRPTFSREQAVNLVRMLKLRRHLEDMGLAPLSLDPNPVNT
jgi:hypothetical protein